MGVSGAPSTTAWLAQLSLLHLLAEQSGQGWILGQKVEIFVVVGALEAAM